MYHGGVLCYIQDRNIRVLNVHGAFRTETVISVPSLIDYTACGHSNGQFTLLNYSDRILACLYETENDNGDAWLIALDVRPGPATQKRIRVKIRLEMPEKLFVRHNKDYLYYGTHSGIGSHGHHEWIIKGVSLRNPSLIDESNSLQLSNLVGSDINCTVAFQIHEGYFYALSNQTSFEVEEVDWTSYYHCSRFPLDKPRKDCIETNREIWRRQHIEGPINDSWTDLDLHPDEASGKLVIVECRREWQGGGSRSQRTYYTQPITFPTRIESTEPLVPPQSSTLIDEIPSSTIPVIPALPIDDPLTSTLDASNKPHWAPPRKRLHRHYHPEEPAAFKPCPSFTFAKTKYRTYNPCSSAFLDLVVDDSPLLSSVTNRLPHQQLRIRIGSRKLASPLNENRFLRLPERNEETGDVLEGSEERFTDRGIRLWPSSNAPAELLDILNPCSDLTDVEATSDERSIVYMAGSSSSVNGRAVVLINFDPAIEFPDLPLLDLRRSSYQPASMDGGTCGVTLESRRSREYNGNGKAHAPVSTIPVPGWTAPWVRTEKAMYHDVGQGFRLC